MGGSCDTYLLLLTLSTGIVYYIALTFDRMIEQGLPG